MKKVFSIIFALLMAAASFSYDFTLKVTPTAMFPFLSAGGKKYDVAGYGGFVDVGMSFF